MSLAEKTLWIIETRRAEAPDLEEIARLAGVSRFHLARAFAEAFGRSLIGYQRARRLTEAARALVFGGDDILTVALDAGYQSNEAFTRAFRGEFGVSPSALRRAGSLSGLTLTDPPRQETIMTRDLKSPEIRDRAAFRVAGLVRRIRHDGKAAIPDLWTAFAPHIGAVAEQAGHAAYGLCLPGGDATAFDYMAGVEVRPGAAPDGLEIRDMPAARYAVFEHEGHVSEIRHSFAAIFDHGLTDAGLEPATTGEFEYYGERFDPMTGAGVIEIWVPVK